MHTQNPDMGFHTVNCISIGNIKWEKEAVFEIPENTICIWQIEIIPGISPTRDLSILLKSDELERANRYYFERDRNRFITSRGALRILLGKYLKKNPTDIEFTITVNKKPSLKEPLNSLYYNTSHSENYILFAFANSEIGIDVEKVDTCFDWNDILQSGFSKDEIVWVQQSKSPKDSFYLLWTRKEALAKAIGKGLQDNLSIFPSLDGTHHLNQFEFSNSWEIRSFKIDKYATGSIAYPPSIVNTKFFIMNIESFV